MEVMTVLMLTDRVNFGNDGRGVDPIDSFKGMEIPSMTDQLPASSARSSRSVL